MIGNHGRKVFAFGHLFPGAEPFFRIVKQVASQKKYARTPEKYNIEFKELLEIASGTIRCIALWPGL